MKHIAILCIALVLLALCVINIDKFLSMEETPQHADILVVLSGNCDRTIRAASLLKSKYSEAVMVTTKPYIRHLENRGVSRQKILNMYPDARTTRDEVIGILALMKKQGYASAIILSDPYHLLRVKLLLLMYGFDSNFRFNLVSSQPSLERRSWWEDQYSRHFVLREIPSLLYAFVAYGILDIEKDPAWVIDAQVWYQRLLNKYL